MSIKKPDPQLLTYREAEALLRIGRAALYRLLDSGQLRRIVIAEQPRLAREEVAALVGKKQSGPPPGPVAHYRRSAMAALKARGVKPRRALASALAAAES